MPLRIDDTKPILEGWLVRGAELRRIFAQRPASLREILGASFQVALQEVEDGVVKAWSPLWRGALSREGVLAKVAELEAEGWTVHPFRPVKIDYAALGRQGASLPRPRGRSRKQKGAVDEPEPPALTPLERAKLDLRLVREIHRKGRAHESRLRRQHQRAS